MKNFTCNIYIGNHGTAIGIQEYITILTDTLGARGCLVNVSTELDENVHNIIIDEFTNFIENKKIANFKKDFPEAVIVYVLTEFIERKHLVTSFNLFGNIFDSSLVALMSVLVRHRRIDFISNEFNDYLVLLLHLPVLLLYGVGFVVWHVMGLIMRGRSGPSLIQRLQAHLHKVAYMSSRYIGLESNIKYADLIITSHESIQKGMDKKKWLNPNQYIGVLYPEINKADVLDNILIDKMANIEITGTISRYRQRWIRKINRVLLEYSIYNKSFFLCRAISFTDKKAKKKKQQRGAFSLHPPQTMFWPYCSPTRLYRALQEDHNIPIITKNYGQHPIEDVCVLYEGVNTILEVYSIYNDRGWINHFLEGKIDKYNAIAATRNDELFSKLSEHVNF